MTMKKFALSLWISLSTILLWAQPYGNEWIDYDNNYRYYEFPVYEDGLHRIPYSVFDQANISITENELENLRLFAFGEEVPIYIETGFDEVFTSNGDYVEFIGEGNDGRVETQNFEDPSWHANPDYSMYNDTILYFLAIPISNNPPGPEPKRFNEVDQSQIEDFAAKPFVWYNSKQVYSEAYHIQPLFYLDESVTNNFRVNLNTYDLGEGWASSIIGFRDDNSSNIQRNFEIPTPFVYTDDPSVQATLETTLIGVSNMTGGEGENDHHIQISQSGSILVNEQYNGYRVKNYEIDRPLESLGEETTIIGFQVVDGLGVARDEQAVSRIQISYPRIPNLESLNPDQEFRFVNEFNNQSQQTRYDFENIQGTNPRIYTFGGNPQRVELNESGGVFPVLLENWNAGLDFECLLSSDESFDLVGSLSPVNGNGFFQNFLEAQEDSAMVIITHKIFMTGPNNVASQYESYREFGTNSLNRNMNVVVVDVDQLYDQFGYGVPKSGLALRNFARFMLEQWNTRPRYLLLLGNSVRTVSRSRTADGSNLKGYRSDPQFYPQNLVPSVGYPMSDNLISAELFGTEMVPQIRTGRISALSPSQAQWYLSKLQEFESQPPALWMKNFMHFGGGTNNIEQQAFASFLDNYAALAADSSFGADVHTFLKTTDLPIEINVSEEINQLIEMEGVSMMTFFAHAGGSAGFDQSIDDPNNFNWNGKYPFLLGNGCYTADFHNANNSSTSEYYTLLQNKGVIGFLATSDIGFPGVLNTFSREFYEQLSKDNYGNSVGDHIHKTIAELEASFGPDIRRKYHCLSFSLQGDPSVILNSWPLPDLVVDDTDIFFTPENITAELDSFTVNVALSNIGRVTQMPFQVSVNHITPNGIGDSTYTAILNGLTYVDTISFKIGIDLQNGLGLHGFHAEIDLPSNAIAELDDFGNNSADAELFLASSGVVPIIPKRYAVVPDEEVILKASTGNPLAEPKNYTVQVDTTDNFDSPLFQSTTISQSGGIIEWQPKLNYPDSVVYFWRCAELVEDDIIWQNSSFQYIPNKEGWGQDHIFQFEGNSLSSAGINRNLREFEFASGDVTIGNNVYGGAPGSFANNVTVNVQEVEYASCEPLNSIYLVILDPVTFEAWPQNADVENPENDFGSAWCRNRVEYYFPFHQSSPDQLNALADLLQSDILDSTYIVLYTIGNVNYANWDASGGAIYDAFQQLGATQIGADGAQDNVPFSLIMKKGNPNTISEIYGTSPGQTINHSYVAQAAVGQGVVKTPKIGPALSWQEGSWKLRSIDDLEGDESVIQLIGINPQGIEVPIPGGQFSLNFPGGEEEIDLSTLVDAQEYPELRLQADLKDLSNTTPLQIDRWHILYEDVPEAAIDPNTHFEFKAETIQQGDPGSISVAIRNISEVDMDSLLVHYWIEDENRERIDISYPRQAPLNAGAILIDTVEFDTRYLSGRNVLWVEVNPKDENGVSDQLEQNHFNNLLQIPFDVTLDTENPLLDVTFDGIHIINGEIVSPQPEVVITLKDENPFLIMDEPTDTSLFKLFLIRPGSVVNEPLYFTPQSGVEEYMQFIPATDQKNRAKVILTPRLQEDGEYTLIVQAADKSGNASANVNYTINFEVIHQSTITEVLNYPNPFTTSTQFVFTLTGSQVPDEFKIQIMTISGKVVREIMLDEFGPIRIGRNISNYRWDARDEFGDRLANGVYLYRVIARINGEDITNRDGGAGQYFKESFGKMVLFR